MKTAFSLIGLCLLGSVATGCKEEPPPPPKPTAAVDTPVSASTAASSNAVAPTPKGAARPRISDATMKQYRVEACYYGSMGLTKARDAYNASLGNAEPSATKLPSFGEYEGAIQKHPRMALGAAQLPFMRHVRSCSVAKSRTEPAYAGLDAAMGDFEPYVNKLNRLMVEANRYYQRKVFEKDDFKRGKELHKELTAEFAQLDAKLAALGAAVQPWQDALPAPTEKLDVSGTLTVSALVEARKLVRALHAKRDDAAIRTHYDAAAAQIAKLDARRKEAGNEPHGLTALPKLLLLRAAAEAQMKDATPFTSEKSYQLTSAMTAIIDAHQRAVQQLLRGKGNLKAGRPFRLMNPRLNAPTLRPQLKSKAENPANPK